MDMKRKLLSVFLALLMVLTILPVRGQAAAGVIAQGVWDPGIYWTLTSDGTLTLKGNRSIQGREEYIWWNYSDKITKIVVSDGITLIPQRCFMNLKKLKSVYIGKTVETIETAAFAGCSELATVTFGKIPVLELIDMRAFAECSKLANFPLDALTSLKTIKKEAFINTRLTKVVTPRSLEKVEFYAFAENPALQTVRLDAADLEMDAYVFQNCTAMEDIYIGETVEASGLFAGCTGLKRVESYGTTWLSLGGLTKLETVIVGKKSQTYGFEGCIALTNVTLCEGVRGLNDQTFAGCKSLVSISLPDSITEIGGREFEGSGIATLRIPKSVNRISMFAFNGMMKEILFEGDAPFIPTNRNDHVVTAYYPANNPTWTQEYLDMRKENYNWIPYVEEPHLHEYTTVKIVGCVDQGYTVYSCACGDTFNAFYEEPVGHHFVNSSCVRCHEPYAGEGINRLSGKNRFETGYAIADRLKEILGVSQFETVIVAYGQNFPDALTGSYLAAVKSAPILLTDPSADAQLLAYLHSNLVPNGKVYILGGTSAVTQSFEDEARNMGYEVKRLKGAGRYETNLAILEEAGVNTTDDVLIATGKNYADSLSASATGLPVLLVDKKLTEEQKAFLATTSMEFVILGGTGAVSTEVEAELASMGTVTRVKGASRYDTSVEIAKRYFDNPRAAVLAYAQGFPDGLCGGPLAISMGAPMILTSNDNYVPADAYIEGITSGVVTGGTGRISDETVWSIFDTVS